MRPPTLTAPAPATSAPARVRVVLLAGYAWVLLVGALLLAGCAASGPMAGGADGAGGFSPAGERAAIEAVMDAQVEAWNAGDVAGFMEGYARRDDLRFASGGTVTYGWEPMLARYRSSYPTPEAMGTLDFRDLDIDVLSQRRALVFGSWHLSLDAGEPASGLFTLLFEKTDAGTWRITHDHTSAAD
jgi:ketosteroid isomerase-like protein